MIKKYFLSMMAAVALLVGVSGCAVNDNPVTSGLSTEEQKLVGLWWDEFEFSDVTEQGVPFTRVLLAVNVEADHTGCLYLGVFDDASDEPLAAYGGAIDAGFKWALLPDGRVQLSDPASGESIALSRRTRGADGGNYGKDMTNVSNTNVNYADGSMMVNNGDYSGTLAKADSVKQADIEKTTAAIRQRLAKEATSEDLGKFIGADGLIYDTADDAINAGTTALAKIAYVGSKNGESAPFNHGLAMALNDVTGGEETYLFHWKTEDTSGKHSYRPTKSGSFKSESGLQNTQQHRDFYSLYPAFSAARINNGTAVPSGCSSWFLASGYQWKKVATAAGGLDKLGLENDSVLGLYWTSSESSNTNAWEFKPYYNSWYSKNKSYWGRVRSFLAF